MIIDYFILSFITKANIRHCFSFSQSRFGD